MPRDAGRRGLRKLLSGAVAVALLGGVCIGEGGESRGHARTDVVTIDTLSRFGELERPPVVFLHDLHTEALKGQKDGCGACHLEGERGLFSPIFQRRGDEGKQAVIDLYHGKCVACHQKRAAGGLKTGPVSLSDCGACHKRRPEVVSARHEMGLDKSLHYRHVRASDRKCERCHHAYDESKRELYHAKGEESSCRDCHGARLEDNRESMAAVSHGQCLGCHLRTIAQNKESGPVSCAGCHDKTKQLAYERVARVPRLKRGQPDIGLVRPAGLKKGGMRTVPFRHELHERAQDTCRVCHHRSLKACGDCHTVLGDHDDGGGIMLSRAMHGAASDRSCVGCHDSVKGGRDCAGCHALMKPGPLGKGTCAVCHAGPPLGDPAIARTKPSSYSSFLPKRAYSRLTWKGTDLPERVEIGLLSDRYEPAIFPHRKVLDALRRDVGKSELAKSFHGGENALCMGCHHAAPAGMRPAACGNCHGKPLQGMDLAMPGLKGAYHLQCMGCHERMGLQKHNGCEACHKERSR
ncbi:MAG: sulfate respiration complex hexadecaheme cytochrome HmcA [Elusimicrobiota bacterium]